MGDNSHVGQVGGQARVVVERGPVAQFARAVKAPVPAAGDVVPPTFLIAATHWGAFAEQQPVDAAPDPVSVVIRGWLKEGGLLLHGEQAFQYHRALRVGDVLDVETEVVDMYEKGSMTFAVAETRYADASTAEPVATGRSTYIKRG